MLNSIIVVAPYWNVNTYRKVKYSYRIKIVVAPYWNVNIVINNFAKKQNCIVVAPYWNVNTGDGNLHVPATGIVVAPYWNVNRLEVLNVEWKKANSSSSILECKYYNQNGNKE